MGLRSYSANTFRAYCTLAAISLVTGRVLILPSVSRTWHSGQPRSPNRPTIIARRSRSLGLGAVVSIISSVSFVTTPGDRGRIFLSIRFQVVVVAPWAKPVTGRIDGAELPPAFQAGQLDELHVVVGGGGGHGVIGVHFLSRKSFLARCTTAAWCSGSGD